MAKRLKFLHNWGASRLRWQLRRLPSGVWLFAGCLLVFLSLHHSEVGQYTEANLTHKLQMLVRERLGQSPKIHPRLRVYALDDYAVGRLKLTDIDMSGWADLIKAFSYPKPRAIVIDKKFGVYPQGSNIPEFKAALAESAPVYTGSNTKFRLRERRNPLDTILNLTRPEYNLKAISRVSLEALTWLPVSDQEAFGPDPGIEDAFARIGHFNYNQMGRIAPLIRVAPDKAIPHLTLLTADALAVDEKGLTVNGKRLALDGKGLVPVNFPSRADLYQSTKSLYAALDWARDQSKQHRPPPIKVQKDDVVIILPLFFTGNVDTGETPLGELPLGFVVVSLVNSVLTGEWLRPLPIHDEAIAAACLLGALAGSYLSPVWFWLCLSLLGITITGLGLGLFAYFGFMLPWFSALLGLGGSGIAFFSMKVARQARVTKAYEIALGGLVSRNSIRELLRNPQAISREASEQLLTIMFIDMVAFSSMAEKEQPKLVFRRLKDTLGSFAEAVHSHGGVVDKTLGDGMLCFFGYNYIGGKTSENHADQAISCALAIQQRHVERNLSELASGEPMIPLRVGINSARVYIGDLGSKERIDFTLIGNGVNFAQRLEAACDAFAILLSEQTLKLATHYSLETPGMKRKKIKVKHHAELFDVIELDPFCDRQELFEKAKKAFLEGKGIVGRDPRWPVVNPEVLVINTPFGRATMLNFSRTGYALALSRKIEEGEHFDITIKPQGSKPLAGKRFPLIVGEVRWVAQEDEHFVHGVRIVNLDEEEKERAYQDLQGLLTRLI